ncbi:MAG: DUF47 domain-containing protein [Chloroflexi bacterium]|nr:DUF47 domain-containing protein [Chloroflexota bacterium]
MVRLRLIPREEKFFDMFEKASRNMLEAAKLLQEMLSHYEDVEKKVSEITEREHQGDAITHDIIAKLNSTFVTPFDREDIHHLTSAIDDVVDRIEAAADVMLIYRIERPTPELQKFASILVRSAEEINSAVPLLRKRDRMKEILNRCIEINRLENEADQLQRAALVALFENPTNTIDVIRWREIYGQLEEATDRCEDVADVLQGMVMKHA